MPTEAKTKKIEELTEKLSRAQVAILIQTQGLNVKDINELPSIEEFERMAGQMAEQEEIPMADAADP